MEIIKKYNNRKLHFPPLGRYISGSELIEKATKHKLFKFTIINEYTGNKFKFILRRVNNGLCYVDYVNEGGFIYKNIVIVNNKHVVPRKNLTNLPNVLMKVIRYFFFTYLENQNDYPTVWVYEN